MKNLSNVDIHEFLSRCRGDRVEGRTVLHENKSYAMPYSTVKIQNKIIKGLRENEERIELIESIINKNSSSRSSYLDVGSNLGVFVRSFDHIFEEVYGVDADWYYVEQCRYLYPDLESSFTLGDLNVTRLTDIFSSSKDVVTALSMIEYIDDKQAFVGDLFSLTNELCIVEGHSESIECGADAVYDSLLRTQNWEVKKLPITTDAGYNAPEATKNIGRPLWVCKKQ